MVVLATMGCSGGWLGLAFLFLVAVTPRLDLEVCARHGFFGGLVLARVRCPINALRFGVAALPL